MIDLLSRTKRDYTFCKAFSDIYPEYVDTPYAYTPGNRTVCMNIEYMKNPSIKHITDDWALADDDLQQIHIIPRNSLFCKVKSVCKLLNITCNIDFNKSFAVNHHKDTCIHVELNPDMKYVARLIQNHFPGRFSFKFVTNPNFFKIHTNEYIFFTLLHTVI